MVFGKKFGSVSPKTRKDCEYQACLLPVLIRLVVGNVFKVIFSSWVMGRIDWAVNKKTQTMCTPPYRRLCSLSLWSSHVGNKSRILGKGYGGKMWCYWEHLEGTLGNLVNKLGA
jgi:hypothetical protein